MHGRTWEAFADYRKGDLCGDCGTLVELGEKYCPSCARRRVWARRKAQRVVQMAQANRVFDAFTAERLVERAVRNVRGQS
jgi:hypothetical protein